MPIRYALTCLVLAVATLVASPLGLAQSLDSLRGQGVIAERYDGYVEIRISDPPPGAKELVEQVNKERRALYSRRAGEQGVEPDAVGRVYAQEILERAPEGTYFRLPSGEYTRK